MTAIPLGTRRASPMSSSTCSSIARDHHVAVRELGRRRRERVRARPRCREVCASFRRAAASIATREKSTPCQLPREPSRAKRSAPRWPAPQPMSSTRSSGRISLRIARRRRPGGALGIDVEVGPRRVVRVHFGRRHLVTHLPPLLQELRRAPATPRSAARRRRPRRGSGHPARSWSAAGSARRRRRRRWPRRTCQLRAR